MNLASLPSPTQSIWHLGPFPVRAYALCIILGIVVAVLMTRRRWVARGGHIDEVSDFTIWVIVGGILGGRIYHVLTTSEPYFGSGGRPLDAFKVWEGGLGIWGAVVVGALLVWLACRRRGVRFRMIADATAPGLVLAQGIGRWGNWFNNELYGRPTDLPWRLQIHQIDLGEGKAIRQPDGGLVVGYFHPTFLYEFLWCALVCAVLLYVDRRFRMGDGRVFALYAVLYGVGRFGIERLRIDEAHHILGMRLNEWTCLVVIVGGLAWLATHRGGREESPYIDRKRPALAAREAAVTNEDADSAAVLDTEGRDTEGRAEIAGDDTRDDAQTDGGVRGDETRR